jgi:hypothetical protein
VIVVYMMVARGLAVHGTTLESSIWVRVDLHMEECGRQRVLPDLMFAKLASRFGRDRDSLYTEAPGNASSRTCAIGTFDGKFSIPSPKSLVLNLGSYCWP